MDISKLTDRLATDDTLISGLIESSWQETDNLKTQIAGLKASKENPLVITAITNLLNSYYIFIGELERALDTKSNKEDSDITSNIMATQTPAEKETSYPLSKSEDPIIKNTDEEPLLKKPITPAKPFEYFVEFEDPIGPPVTDVDLYNN